MIALAVLKGCVVCSLTCGEHHAPATYHNLIKSIRFHLRKTALSWPCWLSKAEVSASFIYSVLPPPPPPPKFSRDRIVLEEQFQVQVPSTPASVKTTTEIYKTSVHEAPHNLVCTINKD
jgi:hypothetical protein